MPDPAEAGNGKAYTGTHEQRLADGAACLQAALAYLARGWSVLAVCPPDHAGVGKEHQKNCTSAGKAPWGPWKEFQDRRATETELRRKWTDNPTLNVGLALGPVSGLVRVDVDGPAGEAKLQELSKGDLPLTLEFTSGRVNGGRGLLYAIPSGVALRTTSENPKHKEELRLQAKGAQTVLPPSRHSAGTLYAWRPGHGPDEIEPAPAPAWLVEALRADGRASRDNGRARHLDEVKRIPEGARDTMLTSLAGSMRRRGMSEDAILAALRAENAARCDPPLPDEQVVKIAHSVARYAPAAGAAVGRVPGYGGQGVLLGPLTLQPGTPRRTAQGKITVPVSVFKAGVLVSELALSSSVSGQKEAARYLARSAAGSVPAQEAEAAVGLVVAAAAEELARPAATGPMLAEFVRRSVPVQLRLTHWAPGCRGPWSEALGRELGRQDLVTYLPSQLVATAASAADAPPDRARLLAALSRELGVLWADLPGLLPPRPPGDLSSQSRLGATLRQALVRVWTVLSCHELRERGPGVPPVPVGRSLAGLVRQVTTGDGLARVLEKARGRVIWWPVCGDRAAWWRPACEDGELVVRLAMRWELAAQVRVELPGIADHPTLAEIGRAYGLIEQGRGRTSRNRVSLAVLARVLSDGLLATPEGDDGDNVGADTEEEVSAPARADRGE
jgi:hypothetical protein